MESIYYITGLVTICGAVVGLVAVCRWEKRALNARRTPFREERRQAPQGEDATALQS
jgi:hypothetical protein